MQFKRARVLRMHLHERRWIELIELWYERRFRARVPLIRDSSRCQQQREFAIRRLRRRQVRPSEEPRPTRWRWEVSIFISSRRHGPQRRVGPLLRAFLSKQLIGQRALIIRAPSRNARELIVDLSGGPELPAFAKTHRAGDLLRPPPVRFGIARRRNHLLHQ